MPCLVIVVIFLLIFAIVAYVLGILIAADIILLFLFISSILALQKAKNLKASKMQCPNCNSEDVRISTVTTGTTSNTSSFKRRGNISTQIHTKRIATCQRCGFEWDYFIQDDIDDMKKTAKNRIVLFGILLILCAIVSVSVFGGDDKTKNTSSTEHLNTNNSVWLDGYTDLNDFDYYIDGDSIHIQKYNGDNSKVRLNESYEIEGSEKHIVSFTEATFLFSNVDSVVIPEGTQTLENNTFNSCGIKFLYLPASLQKPEDSFWGYFHDVEKIYYGGTEEQWNNICTIDRAELDAKQIIFEASSKDLK